MAAVNHRAGAQEQQSFEKRVRDEMEHPDCDSTDAETHHHIAELRHGGVSKDAFDIVSLLLNNEIGSEKDGSIDLERIASLCAQDWGLYKTTSINLNRVEDLLADEDLKLKKEERELILGRVRQIQKAFDDMPKSLAWQMRDKVGTRVRWYMEVEEVDQ